MLVGSVTPHHPTSETYLMVSIASGRSLIEVSLNLGFLCLKGLEFVRLEMIDVRRKILCSNRSVYVVSWRVALCIALAPPRWFMTMYVTAMSCLIE